MAGLSQEFITQTKDDYLRAAIMGDRRRASQVIHAAKAQGATLKQLYLDVFQPAQHELGERWQCGQLTVAQEHLATAITEIVMTELYADIFSVPKIGSTVVALCAVNKMHEVGIRMVCDFFEIEGWEAIYLGNYTPIAEILDALERTRAQLLAVSAASRSYANWIAALVKAVKQDPRLKVPIMVGGLAFNQEPGLWQEIGADGYAPSGDQAVVLASSLRERYEQGRASDH